MSIPWDRNHTTSIYDLINFAAENNIPSNARIQYQGCGSHGIEFVWSEEDPTESLEK